MKSRMVLAKVRKLARSIVLTLVLAAAVLLACDYHVSYSTREHIYSRIDDLPDTPVAVVLGTSKFYGGSINSFYRERIEAAAALFKAGKVKAVVASGDNATRQYNEPRMLRKDLIKLGIPADRVTMDFAGFRTLDSVVRAKEVFGLDTFVVVSQRFQAERAIYIARAHDINAVGFVAENPPVNVKRWRVRMREVFARFLAVLDVNLLGTMPRFLGPQVDVNTGDGKAEQTQDAATPIGDQRNKG